MGEMARVTRLELATSGVTGRRSNQLSYTRICTCMGGEAAQVEELCISVNYTLAIIPHISHPRRSGPDFPAACRLVAVVDPLVAEPSGRVPPLPDMAGVPASILLQARSSCGILYIGKSLFSVFSDKMRREI